MADEPTGLPPVALLANSYDVQALAKQLDHAATLKTEDGRTAAIDKAVRDGAAFQDIVAQLDAPQVPEGCELAEIETLDGRTITHPVSTPAAEGEDAASIAQAVDKTGEVVQVDPATASVTTSRGGAAKSTTTSAAD